GHEELVVARVGACRIAAGLEARGPQAAAPAEPDERAGVVPGALQRGACAGQATVACELPRFGQETREDGVHAASMVNAPGVLTEDRVCEENGRGVADSTR